MTFFLATPHLLLFSVQVYFAFSTVSSLKKMRLIKLLINFVDRVEKRWRENTIEGWCQSVEAKVIIRGFCELFRFWSFEAISKFYKCIRVNSIFFETVLQNIFMSVRSNSMLHARCMFSTSLFLNSACINIYHNKWRHDWRHVRGWQFVIQIRSPRLRFRQMGSVESFFYIQWHWFKDVVDKNLNTIDWS